MTATLVASFGIDPDTARRHTSEFRAFLRRTGLCRITGERQALAPAPHAPSADKACLDALFRSGDRRIRVCCEAPGLATAIARLAAPLRMQDEGSQDRVVHLVRCRGSLVLERDGIPMERIRGAMPAKWRLIRELVAPEGTGASALLHASAAAAAEGAVIVCGDSGAGKSTLLLGMLAAGLSYVADDILPLDVGTGRVRATHLAIGVKEGSWPIGATLFPELATVPVTRLGGRAIKYFWPGSDAAVDQATPLKAALLVFPVREAGTEPRFAMLDARQALIRLGRGGSVLPSTDEGLAAFFAWLEEVPAVEIVYDRLADGVALVEQVLGRIAQPGRGRSGLTYPQVLTCASNEPSPAA